MPSSAELQLLLVKLIEQITLVGIAVSIAIVIGLPLGIISAAYPRFRRFAFTLINFFQTIPSLALLTFLLPFFGIGTKPATFALSVYALLPIVRNTATGIMAIAPELKMTAEGLGMRTWQRLCWVELPLAAPMIIAGVRTATTFSVGTATLAAFIGAGGLGDFINQGLAMSNNRLILLGAIPAALLAISFDGIFAMLERCLKVHGQDRQRRWHTPLYLISGVAVFFIASKVMLTVHNTEEAITIGSKNFTEQVIISEIMAQLIEAKTDLKVNRHYNLGSSTVVHQALEKGDIDLYPEYTGSALMLVMKHPEKHDLPPEALYHYVRQYYRKHYDMTWLAPFGFDDITTLLVREAYAQEYHLQRMSDLVPLASKLTLGVPSEALQRPDGVPGLRRVYNFRFKKVREMDLGLMYQAIDNRMVDVVAGLATDGRISRLHLHALVDDKHLYPSFIVAPVLRRDTLRAYPQLKSVLTSLGGKISDSTMRELNYAVDGEKQDYHEVARKFLVNAHLVG